MQMSLGCTYLHIIWTDSCILQYDRITWTPEQLGLGVWMDYARWIYVVHLINLLWIFISILQMWLLCIKVKELLWGHCGNVYMHGLRISSRESIQETLSDVFAPLCWPTVLSLILCLIRCFDYKKNYSLGLGLSGFTFGFRYPVYFLASYALGKEYWF